MNLYVRVVSRHPPGGRCTLYADYAEVLAAYLDARTEIVLSTERDAHGSGFPSLLVNGLPVQPGDGVILMPADLCALLSGSGTGRSGAGRAGRGAGSAAAAHDGRRVRAGAAMTSARIVSAALAISSLFA